MALAKLRKSRVVHRRKKLPKGKDVRTTVTLVEKAIKELKLARKGATVNEIHRFLMNRDKNYGRTAVSVKNAIFRGIKRGIICAPAGWKRFTEIKGSSLGNQSNSSQRNSRCQMSRSQSRPCTLASTQEQNRLRSNNSNSTSDCCWCSKRSNISFNGEVNSSSNTREFEEPRQKQSMILSQSSKISNPVQKSCCHGTKSHCWCSNNITRSCSGRVVTSSTVREFEEQGEKQTIILSKSSHVSNQAPAATCCGNSNWFGRKDNSHHSQVSSCCNMREFDDQSGKQTIVLATSSQISHLSPVVSCGSTNSLDVEEFFFMSLRPALHNLNAEQRSGVMLKINQVLQDSSLSC